MKFLNQINFLIKVVINFKNISIFMNQINIEKYY